MHSHLSKGGAAWTLARIRWLCDVVCCGAANPIHAFVFCCTFQQWCGVLGLCVLTTISRVSAMLAR
jgi:hypothetical protein